MTTMTTNLPKQNNDATIFARMTRAVRLYLEQRETRIALERLSERELSDIGLTRTEIRATVKGMH